MPRPSSKEHKMRETIMTTSLEHDVKTSVADFLKSCGYAPQAITFDIKIVNAQDAEFNRIRVTTSVTWEPS